MIYYTTSWFTESIIRLTSDINRYDRMKIPGGGTEKARGKKTELLSEERERRKSLPRQVYSCGVSDIQVRFIHSGLFIS